MAPGGTLGSVGLPGDNLPAGGSDFFFFFPFKRGKIVGNYPARQGGCPSVCPSVRQLAGPLAASWQVLLVGPVCSIAGKGAPPPTGLGPQAPRSRCSGPGAWRAVSCSGSGRASPPSSAPPQAAAGTRGRCETGSGRGLSADAAGGRRASRLSLKSLLQEQGTGSGAVEETASPGGGGGGGRRLRGLSYKEEAEYCSCSALAGGSRRQQGLCLALALPRCSEKLGEAGQCAGPRLGSHSQGRH